MPASSPTPVRKPGRVAKKSTSSTPAQIRLSAFACAWAGVWNACTSVGIARIAADSVVSVTIIRARGESKRCGPLRTAPTKNASPSTRTLFAITEPTSADWTTRVSPRWSANRAMKSSGRLPSADCTLPATDEPSRLPSCSVAVPTRRARTAIASAAKINESTGVAPL